MRPDETTKTWRPNPRYGGMGRRRRNLTSTPSLSSLCPRDTKMKMVPTHQHLEAMLQKIQCILASSGKEGPTAGQTMETEDCESGSQSHHMIPTLTPALGKLEPSPSLKWRGDDGTGNARQ